MSLPAPTRKGIRSKSARQYQNTEDQAIASPSNANSVLLRKQSSMLTNPNYIQTKPNKLSNPNYNAVTGKDKTDFENPNYVEVELKHHSRKYSSDDSSDVIEV